MIPSRRTINAAEINAPPSVTAPNIMASFSAPLNSALQVRTPGQVSGFNEQAYLAANPDVAAAVQGGSIKSGREHYQVFGQLEGRSTGQAGQGIQGASSPRALSVATRGVATYNRLNETRGIVGAIGNVSTGLSAVSLIGKAAGTGIGTFATGTINSIGASVGFGGVTPAFIGPSLPGVGAGANAGLLSSTSLSGVLNGAGIGGLVGTAYGALFGVDNPANASYGGTIGGAIGSAVLPGVGTAIGSVLGSVVGGFFGSRPHPASTVGLTISETGTVTSGGVQSKHLDDQYGAALGSEFAGFAGELGKLGLAFDPTRSLHGGVDDGQGFVSLDGGIKSGGQGIIKFDSENAREASSAVAQLVLSRSNLGASNAEVAKAVQQINPAGKTTNEILAEIKAALGTTKNNIPQAPSNYITPNRDVRQQVADAVTEKKTQYDEYVEKVTSGNAGIPSTIVTGTGGINLSDENIGRLALFGVN